MLGGMVFSTAAALTVLPVLVRLAFSVPLARMLERTIHPGDINASIRIHAYRSVLASVFVSAFSWAGFLQGALLRSSKGR
jgi:hypothetical protein